MMNFRKIFTITAFLLVVVTMVAGISIVMRQMNELRNEKELTDTAIVENAPPVVAFTTVALGSFRGLVADFLWLRSAQAKEKGNYFEMMQLASWIVKLQPRFTEVAAYLAWNMSYNVSVTFSNPEERWRWVQKGIELLRDQALEYNPGDPMLYWELGWIYQHKLGMEMDAAHKYYKVQLAKEITNVLGKYPVDWKKWAGAPSTNGELKKMIPDYEVFQQKLSASTFSLNKLEKYFRNHQTFPQRLGQELEESGLKEDLELYLRKRWLREKYKLNIDKMWQLNKKYGNLDWRLPEAHAIYWASKGLKRAEGELNVKCERMIFQALNSAFQSGRAIYVKSADALEITQNVSLADSVKEVYLKTMRRHPENEGIRSGYKNFLIDATVSLYLFGQDKKAEEYYNTFNDRFKSEEKTPKLSNFVLAELAEDIENASFNKAQSIIYGYLFRSYRSLAFGDVERAERLEEMARRIWNKYMDSVADEKERKGLAPYENMKQTMYKRCINNFNQKIARKLKAAEKELNNNEKSQ